MMRDDRFRLAGTRAERAKENAVSLKTQGKQDRLTRLRRDLLEEVLNGRLSVHAAAVRAGIEKLRSPQEKAQLAYLRLPVNERAEFLAWCREKHEVTRR